MSPMLPPPSAALNIGQARPEHMPASFKGDTVYLRVRINDQDFVFYTDSGGGLLITQAAARRAGLGSQPVRDRRLAAQLPPDTRTIHIPAWRPSNVPLPADAPLFTVKSARQIRGWPSQGDGILGQAWFAGHTWTWDYPHGNLWLDGPGWKPSSASAHPLAVEFRTDGNRGPVNHFLRITATIDGRRIPLLLDTGAETFLTQSALRAMHDGLPRLRATSMIMQRLFSLWHLKHPHWPYLPDAQSTTHAAMLKVPDVVLAGVHLGPVWFTSRPNANFERFMSSMTAGPVYGSLGGNAFASMKLTVDYVHARAWIDPGRQEDQSKHSGAAE